MEKQKQTLIRRESRSDGKNEYEYSLYIGESTLTASYGLSLYSISINLKKENGNKQSSEITDAFSDGNHALHFFEKLVDDLVSPFNLSYIFELDMAKV